MGWSLVDFIFKLPDELDIIKPRDNMQLDLLQSSAIFFCVSGYI